MTARAGRFAGACVLIALIALTVGSYVLLVAAAAMAAILALSLVSCAVTLITLDVKAECSPNTVLRGESAALKVKSRHFSPVPPGEIVYGLDSGERLILGTCPFLTRSRAYSMRFVHRGIYTPGGGRVRVGDIFNLFSFSKKINHKSAPLTVLPVDAYEYEALPFSMDTGEAAPRLQDDAQEPSGVREWREGDQIRRIHWKLTMKNLDPREGYLKPIVKTYDEAVKPDVLILPDTGSVTGPEKRRRLIEDTVCECALSAASAYYEAGNTVRLICGSEEADMGGAALLLAGVSFSGESSFETAAAEVMKRTGRTANAVFVKARLSYRDADMLIRLRRSALTGIELIWVTDSRVSEVERLSARLEAGGVRVRVVAPEDGQT